MKKIEHAFVFCIGVTALLAGIGLNLYGRSSPFIVAILLALGVASLVYGFLGGISDASYRGPNFTLGGTLAALVIVTTIANSYLEKQIAHLHITNSDIAGRWRWEYPEHGWSGTIYFTEESGRLRFSGTVHQYTEDAHDPAKLKARLIYRLTDGDATIVTQGGAEYLKLRCKVSDLTQAVERNYVWVTKQPLDSGLAFKGVWDAENPTDDSLAGAQWGVTLRRTPPIPPSIGWAH